MSEPASEPPTAEPSTARPLTVLPGVGPAKAARLERLGLRTLHDLVVFAPQRIEVIGPDVSVREALGMVGRTVGVRARVERFRLVRRGWRRSALRVRLNDGEAGIDAVFFNQPWLRDALEVGEEFAVYGPVVGGDAPQLMHPRVATEARPLPVPGTRLPVYPQTDGVSQEFLRGLCQRALEEPEGQPEELLPAALLEERDLPPLDLAVRELHLPTSDKAHERARRRVAFEHIIALQARLQRRRASSPGQARRISTSEANHEELLARFPFQMTSAQRSVIAEIRSDLERDVPMRRLLQGDVGAGKTAVGLYAVLAVAAAGGQAAFLAPTELLAEQHFDGTRSLLAAAGIEARFLTGSLRPAAKRAVLRDVADGSAAVVFGTHALFSSSVEFRSLDLAVIDEQQRFGVAQRRALLEKGADVHALLMTATPIPRTLALTLYGDLDTSLVRERPPGRGAISTQIVAHTERAEALARAAEHLARGERVFWIVPRIETSEVGPGVEEVFEELSASPLGRHGVERVHGGVPPDERSRRLEQVRTGGTGLLVATTVIEVGLDVPEATLCVIDGADRFGLAQLHQLRGRVGRGASDAHCVLVAGDAVRERLEILENTNDGFRIAEEDLGRRGMGDLGGLRQAGENREGLLDPELDAGLLIAARDLVAAHPDVRERYADR